MSSPKYVLTRGALMLNWFLFKEPASLSELIPSLRITLLLVISFLQMI